MTAIRCVAIGATVSSLLLACGCTGQRRRASQSPVRNAYAENDVHPDHLDRIGDSLAKQGHTAQAREMYNLAEQRRANVRRPTAPARTAGRSSQSNPAVIPSAPVRTQQVPRVPPAAPPAELPPPPEDKPDIPIINGRTSTVPITTVQRIDPVPEPELTPGIIGRPMRITSNRAVTDVRKVVKGIPEFRQPANLGSADQPHTIRIIPASKGGPVKVRELRYGHPVLMPPDPEEHQTATSGLKRTSAEEAVMPAPKDLKSAESVLAWLSRAAKQPTRHAEQIASLLTHSSADVRSLSAFLLGRCGESAGQFSGELEAHFDAERNGPTRVRMAEALLRVSPGHERAAFVLEEALQSTERATRWEAVCIADILAAEASSDVVVRRLIDRLNDPDANIRVMAALKLGEFRHDVKISAPALEEAVIRAHTQPKLRTAALTALRVLRDTNSEPQITARIAGQ